MPEQADIKRKIYGKTSFSNVVDTEFNQLITSTKEIVNPTSSTEEQVKSFFSSYESLFYDIPKEGTNSHLELVNKSSEYLGISYQDLLQELRITRDENITLKNQLITVTS